MNDLTLILLSVLVAANVVLDGECVISAECRGTDVAARKLVYIAGIMPLFLPSYVGALAWVIIAGPSAGLFNVLMRDLVGNRQIVMDRAIAGAGSWCRCAWPARWRCPTTSRCPTARPTRASS